MECGSANHRTILHLDLDAFYASVEELDHPEYKDYPLIVGANPGQTRGVVSTCNYAARKFGIRSAMPVSEAKRRCPGARFVPVRMQRYKEMSDQFFRILESYTPGIEPLSIDEAFLDVTSTLRYFRTDGEGIARQIQKQVEQTGLSVSAGVASNKFVAKIASDLRKPAGIVVCPAGTEADFLKDLSIDKMWGVGPVLSRKLRAGGVSVFGDLLSKDSWKKTVTEKESDRLVRLAAGIDNRPVERRDRKSLSVERTFSRDISEPDEIKNRLLSIADELIFRMIESGFRGRTLVFKLRYSDFSTITRQLPFDSDELSVQNVYSKIMKVFGENYRAGEPLRLLGIGFTNRTDESELFVPQTGKTDSLMFQLKKKYGKRIGRASLLPKEKGN